MAGQKAKPRRRAGYYCLFFLAVALAYSLPVQAQNHLNRISLAERSDGLGYVIRYHLTERADSFKVVQPAEDLIQLILYTESIDTSGVTMFTPSGHINSIRSFQLSDGYGFDLHLEKDAFYKATSYDDRNSSDLLLALEETHREELVSMTETATAIDWSTMTVDPSYSESSSYLDDEYYAQNRDNLNFDTIVIDAGHGGKDPGNLGVDRAYEKDIALAIALQLGTYINQHMPDVNVVYTRDDDTFIELEERGRIANRANGDLFVSIHANAYHDRRVRGSEIYFLGLERSNTALEVMKRENSVIQLESGNSREELTEAELLIYELANASNIGLSERIAGMMEYQFRERAGRHSRGVKQARFVVLYHASMPALLVETGFLTNPTEAEYLSTKYGQEIVASAIFRAIRDFRDEYEKSRTISRSD